MNKAVLYFIFLFFLVTDSTPLMAQPDECNRMENRSPYWRLIKAKKVLRIGIGRFMPPFSAINKKGEFVGIDVELAKIIGEKLKVKITLVPLDISPVDERITYLEQNKVDLVIADFTITSHRGVKVNFSHSYYSFTLGAFLDNSYIPDFSRERDEVAQIFENYYHLRQIPGLVIGVIKNSVHEEYVKRDFPSATIQTYPTGTEALEALLKRKVMAVVFDSPYVSVFKRVLRMYRFRIKALLRHSIKQDVGIAIRKGDLEFLNWLNILIEELKDNKTLDKIIAKYVDNGSWLSGIDFKKSLGGPK